MSEYIIRVDENDERWEYVKQQYTHFFGYPIADEVVRCEDCKYMSRDTNVFKWCYRLSPEFACELNGFCAWGKRREP